MKIRLVGADMFHADGQTDGHAILRTRLKWECSGQYCAYL